MIGATNQAEFFAVATETFFEPPHELRRQYPELFAESTATTGRIRPCGCRRPSRAGTAGREVGTQAGILAATLRLQPDRPSGLVLPI
jgi:hypothetical protein